MAGDDHSGASGAARIGEQIGGYRLLDRLGDGSTSTVFLGEHVRLGRRAAIKVLTADFTDDAHTVGRLLNEARVVNDIRHPNIVDIWDFVEQDAPRRVALVMEYVEGPSLETFRRDPLDGTQALALSLQLVDAVQAAHARGVIHRDLKPANLLLTFDPRVEPERDVELKVVDFGIAKVAGPHAQGLTVTGTMLGTPAYMAPEQIAGSPAPSPATDVFALGAVVYELLTGDRAYPSPRLQETVRMKLRGELPELSPLHVSGGTKLLELVKACLHRQPSSRPRLDEVRRALDAALRAAAGAQRTDALELPTIGLTSASPLPGAATELSEIPPEAVVAARRSSAGGSAAVELPELAAMLDEDEDEDEVGTELARPSLDLPAFDLQTEESPPQAPAWARSQRDVATGMAVEGIPDHPSSPTNRVLDAITHEIAEPQAPTLPPEASTAPGQHALLTPAGVPELGPEGDHRTATIPRREAIDDAPPASPTRQLSAAKASPSTEDARPDKLFASGVGLEVPPPSSPSVDLVVPAPAPGRGRAALVGLLVLLVAGVLVGVAVLGGVLDVPAASDAPAPVAPPPPPAPTATPASR